MAIILQKCPGVTQPRLTLWEVLVLVWPLEHVPTQRRMADNRARRWCVKQHIDELMADRDLDAILVQGKVLGNPPLLYMLNGIRMTSALVIKKRGEEPVLIVGPMERDTAALVGYPVKLTTRYEYSSLLKAADGDALKASVAYYARIFEDLDIRGRVGCYGYMDQGYAYALLAALNAGLTGVEMAGEVQDDLIQAARGTKDGREAARIREVGRQTVSIVEQTVAFLQSHRVGTDETLRKADGTALTVGDTHGEIMKLLAQQGLEDPEGFIFSTGRESGVPHSRGNLAAPLRLGQSIVFDIFPREAGGGYFFDLTRTFCLGYAPEPVARLHRDVVDCLTMLQREMRVGEEVRHYQQLTCAFLRDRGHPTIEEDPATQKGYVHSIGHGVGLDIHEVPSFRDDPGNVLRVAPGYVFAMEPGLYYPEEGMGCRVEDMLWIAEDGTVHNLTQMPYDLVVPVEL
jgi:Xaa-Pro aminopeptidase